MSDPYLRLRRAALRHVDRLGARFGSVAERQFSSRAQYSSLARLAARYGYQDLAAAEVRVFSQNGEDGVLAEIFARIGVTNRYFIEFGAQNGVVCNTRFLMEVLGWHGLYLEALNKPYEQLARRLAARSDVTTVRAFVTPDNVEDLFSDAGAPAEPDLVSIDVDGQDYWIWEAIVSFRPRVVVVEYNSTLTGVSWVEPKAATDSERLWVAGGGYGGASRDALSKLARAKGYTLVYEELAGVNLFFVRDDLSAGFAEPLPRGSNFDLVGRSHPPPLGGFIEV